MERNFCRATMARSGENQKPLKTSWLYFGIKAPLDSIHTAALQPRQVNRRDHAARAATAELNRSEFKRDKPRMAAQSFALVLG